MKNRLLPFSAAIVIALIAISAFAFNRESDKEDKNALREMLVEQLKTTHNKKEWFVPINIALEGVTLENSKWDDHRGNHSIGQLTYHLSFWNQRQLNKMKGVAAEPFSGLNDETFQPYDANTWYAAQKNLDKILTDIENLVAASTDEQLKEWGPTIAKVSTHNAYHTGQIIYIRKQQGSWDAEKGVK